MNQNNTIPASGSSERSQIIWEKDGMQTTFANVVNIQGTREQIDLFFGINRSWESGEDVVVDLINRVIVTPHAAKRMHTILSGVLREYEARHGPLDVDAG